MKRYWLTPPELEQYRQGRWDPCPYPRQIDYDALTIPWEKPWYCNPPFDNYTAFVRKAIKERPGILVGPCPTAIVELLNAGAEYVEGGRFHWLEADTKEPWKHPNWAAVWRL